MIVYCYRSGQIGFALREIPDGAIAIAKGPHPITEAAVHGCARLAYDNETWLVPGIPEATNEEAAYQAMLAFEKRLKDRIRELVQQRRQLASRKQRTLNAPPMKPLSPKFKQAYLQRFATHRIVPVTLKVIL